jgi:hypothetical protein
VHEYAGRGPCAHRIAPRLPRRRQDHAPQRGCGQHRQGRAGAGPARPAGPQARADAARAGWVAADANYAQAAADFKRFKELRDQGFISSAELERRDTALTAAKAQLDQTKAQFSAQGNQAAYAALVADAAA